MTRTDADILKIANEHNIGDLALGYTLETRDKVGQLVNRDALRYNVFPGMVVNRNNPERNYVFVWCPMTDKEYDRQFVNDIKRDGYEPVLEADWIVSEDAWTWQTPEKWRFRWSVTRLLLNDMDEFLMYRDEDKWAAQMEKRRRFNDERIDQRYDESLEAGARIAHNKGIGVEVSGTKPGGKTSTIKPSTRRTVS